MYKKFYWKVKDYERKRRIYKMFHGINKNLKYMQNDSVGYINLSEEFKNIVGYDIIDYYTLCMVAYGSVANKSNN